MGWESGNAQPSPASFCRCRIGLPGQRRSGIWTGDGDVAEWLKAAVC
jgi:hypothetical protein